MVTAVRRLLYLIIFIAFGACMYAQTLTIATAANFREPMEEISRLFMKENPAIAVRCVYGSSGNLYQQIANHAPFDIFFSADTGYVYSLYKAGITDGPPQIYAVGQLVLWSLSKDVSEGVSSVTSTQIKKIAIANPQLAPYGKSAMQCLQYFDLYDRVKNKLVLAENIAQTAQFASTGNSDAGFLAMSQLRSKAIQHKGSYFVVPTESYSPIKQGAVILKNKENEAVSLKFMDFMSSEKVKAIILAYGYKSGNL